MENKLSLICKGISVSEGIVHGFIKKLDGNTSEVSKSDILLLESSDPGYAVEVMKAGGVILERGGRLAHLCIIALEMGIPCITQAERAMELLKNREKIVLDASEGAVYEWV